MLKEEKRSLSTAEEPALGVQLPDVLLVPQNLALG